VWWQSWPWKPKCSHVRKLQEQETELADTQASLDWVRRRVKEVEQHAADLDKQLEQLQNSAQLEQYHAVGKEEHKWEVREER